MPRRTAPPPSAKGVEDVDPWTHALAARLAALPPRRGPRPQTRQGMPHQQLTQNAPPELQEALFARARTLPGVTVAPSGISVPGARAFVLADSLAGGPPEAFMVGREFAHLHPPYDGSMHLALPAGWARRAEELGWAEPHPLVRWGAFPPGFVMVYGPRDEEELEAVWTLLQASYAFARGLLPDAAPLAGAAPGDAGTGGRAADDAGTSRPSGDGDR